MVIFGIATLTPVLLLVLAAGLGGVWVVCTLLYLTTLTYVLDSLVKVAPAQRPESEFPVAHGLSLLLAVLHFPVLGICVWAISHGTLSWIEAGALFLSAGLFFGQVSNANAHELIHRPDRLSHRLGMWVYISLLFGHHTSAHVLVHHRHVATDDDPNTSRLGESYYAYLTRAWVGSFLSGYRAEAARLAQISRSPLRNPYLIYVAGGIVLIACVGWFAGLAGVLAYVLLSLYAQSQLLLSDYVQHYGLQRARDENGKPQPVSARHSWNSRHWFTSAMMLNAPRHSDHHTRPTTPYPALLLADDAPMLPRSLPAMATLALFPRLWFRVMDHRVARWRS